MTLEKAKNKVMREYGNKEKHPGLWRRKIKKKAIFIEWPEGKLPCL